MEGRRPELGHPRQYRDPVADRSLRLGTASGEPGLEAKGGRESRREHWRARVVVPKAPFGSWLLGQFFEAARNRLGEQLLGTEQERALRGAGVAAIAQTARELRPGGSDENVKHLAAVLDEVFWEPMPAAPFEEQPTILQALQTGIAVLGDASLTDTEESSARALGLSVEEITETLIRNVVQEI